MFEPLKFEGEDRESAVRKATSQMSCTHLTDSRGRGTDGRT
jgi:hypothetical protein